MRAVDRDWTPFRGTAEDFIRACEVADARAAAVAGEIDRLASLDDEHRVHEAWLAVDFEICNHLGRWEGGQKWDDHGNALDDATVAISSIWHWLDDMIKAWNRHCPQLYAARAAEDARSLWPQIAKVIA